MARLSLLNRVFVTSDCCYGSVEDNVCHVQRETKIKLVQDN